jgi:hypothetical protein
MKTFLITMCILAYYSVHAQWYVGGKAGVVLADYESPTEFKSTLKQGIMIGLTASGKLNYDFGIQLDLEYMEKGYHHYVCNTIYEKLETTFIQIPFMLSYNIPFAEKLKVRVKAGGYAAWWLSAKYSMEGYKPSTTEYDFDARGAKRFDFGPSAGAEAEYLLHNGNVFGLEFRYDLGVQDMETAEGGGSNTNRTMSAGLFYKFLLGK